MIAEPITETNEIVKVVEQSGLEQQTAKTLLESFTPFFEKADEWRQKAETLVVTDVSQTREMKMAREARLALKEIRVNADKTRKALKEDSIRYGKAVQGVYNVIEYLIVPIEQHLEKQEKFAEIQEAERRAKLKAEREAEIQPYVEFIPYGLDFSVMTDEDYAKTLNGARLQLQAKVEAELRAEQERIAKEKAEAEERERIRIENERLRAEAEARERQMAEERAKAEAERKALEEQARKEREAAEAKLRAEAEARAKVEAELKAKAEAEAKAKREAEEKAAAELKAKQLAEKKAKAAPDKAKLTELAKTIGATVLPEVKSEDAQKIVSEVKTLLEKVVAHIQSRTESI